MGILLSMFLKLQNVRLVRVIGLLISRTFAKLLLQSPEQQSRTCAWRVEPVVRSLPSGVVTHSAVGWES